MSNFKITNELDEKITSVDGTENNIIIFSKSGTIADSGISISQIENGGQAKQPSAIGDNIAIFGTGSNQGQTIDSGFSINDSSSPSTTTLWSSDKTNSTFLPLTGGTMTGNITIPTGNIITLTDTPSIGSSAANKTYVDSSISSQYPIPISMGGTGQITADTALNALLPTQTGQNGKVLGTDGTNTSWVSSTSTITNLLSSAANIMSSTVNGILATANIINTNVLSSSANLLTSTVNGVAAAAANIINTNVLSSSANLLTSTVNGVAAAAVNIINTNVLSSSANLLTSTVNGIASTAVNIINTNVLSSSANLLTSTVNGIASATANIINSINLNSAANVLTVTVNGISSTAVDVIDTNILSSSINLLTSTVNGIASTAVTIINSINLNSVANGLTVTVNGVVSTTANIINSINLNSIANGLTVTVNGITSTAVTIINSINLNSIANGLTVTVNGVASATANIINTNTLTLVGNALTSSVNGIASAAVSVQTLISGSINGDIVTVNSSGQTTDSGKTFGNDGTNATIPTSSQMQNYVTTQLLNTPTLPAAQFASTANITTFSGLTTIDGYTPNSGDFLLIKNQTNGDNGIWQVTAGSWSRCFNNSGVWSPITTQTIYSQLNINGGVLNILNGTVGKNIQYQITIVNPAATFGSSIVYVTALTKNPVRDVFLGYVDANIGNNTNNNGTSSFPYATVTQDLVGASYPHITYIAPSGGNYTETLSLGSGNSNLTVICCDSSIAGKCQFSTTLTLGSGNTRYSEVGITRSTGSSTCIILGSGNLGRHNFENCIWTTTGTSLMTLDPSLTNWINIFNVDATGSPLASIVIPNFTSTFTFNFYRQTKPIAFSFAAASTGTNCIINIFNSAKGIIGIPNGFTGTIVYYDGYNVNSIITSQSTLNAILASTNPALNGYYAVSFASPTGMPAGCIFGKFSSGGFTANNIVEQFLTCTTPSIYDYTTQQVFVKNGSGSFNAWVAGNTGAYLPLTGGTMAGNITIPTGNLITLTDAPSVGTSAANKTYVDNSISSQYPIPIAMGGTGQITSNTALNALLPTQTGQNGKVLGTDGTNTSWVSSTSTITNLLSSAANIMSSTVNGILATANIINTNVLSSSANLLTSTVNGVSSAAANIINTNVLSSSANLLTSTVNGIASTAVNIINTNVLSSSANLLTSTVNGIASAAANIINTNVLTLSGVNLSTTINGILSNTVTVQPLISSPTANDIVTTSGTGQVQDSGISITTSGSQNVNTNVMTSAGTQSAIALASTSTPTANMIAKWDANVNLNANSFVPKCTIYNSSATVTLTVTSNECNIFTNSISSYTCVLPNATTCSNGQQFWLMNETISAIPITDNSSNILYQLEGGSDVLVTLKSNTTAAGLWHLGILEISQYPYSFSANATLSIGQRFSRWTSSGFGVICTLPTAASANGSVFKIVNTNLSTWPITVLDVANTINTSVAIDTGIVVISDGIAWYNLSSSTSLYSSYISVVWSGTQVINTTPTIIKPTTIIGGNIPYSSSTGTFNLVAGVTYELTATLNITVSATTAYMYFAWCDVTSGNPLNGISQGLASGSLSTGTGNPPSIATGIYTPSSNQTINLQAISTGGLLFSSGTIIGVSSNVRIEQIGPSQAITNITSYATASLSSNFPLTPLNATIPFVANSTGSIPNNGGVFTLTAGNTYELESWGILFGATGAGQASFCWMDATTNAILPNATSGSAIGGTVTTNPAVTRAIYTATTNQTIKVGVTQASTAGNQQLLASPYGSYAKIKQIATQPIVGTTGSAGGNIFTNVIPTTTFAGNVAITLTGGPYTFTTLGGSITINWAGSFYSSSGTGPTTLNMLIDGIIRDSATIYMQNVSVLTRASGSCFLGVIAAGTHTISFSLTNGSGTATTNPDCRFSAEYLETNTPIVPSQQTVGGNIITNAVPTGVIGPSPGTVAIPLVGAPYNFVSLGGNVTITWSSVLFVSAGGSVALNILIDGILKDTASLYLPTGTFGTVGKCTFLGVIGAGTHTVTFSMTAGTAQPSVNGGSSYFNATYSEYGTAVISPNVNIWTLYTPVITATTTTPTIGSGTTLKGYYMQNGKILNLQMFLSQTSSGTAGSGTYLFTIPTGFTINTAITGVYSSSAPFPLPTIGVATADIGNNVANLGTGSAIVYSTTQFFILIVSSGNPNYAVNDNYFSLANGNLAYSANLSIPIL